MTQMTGNTASRKQNPKSRRTFSDVLKGSTALARIPAAALILGGALAAPAAAADSTWLETPFNGDYNTFFNWNTGDVPSSAGDTAVFGQSNTTLLTISAPVVVDAWVFNADADNYVFTNDQTLTFVGDGIVINGGVQGIVNNAGGGVYFFNSSGAGDISIVNNEDVVFTHQSSAENATIANNDELYFAESATAGDASITNNSITRFIDTSTAGNATITNGATLSFDNSSSAGNATITNNQTVSFYNDSTAGSATIQNNIDLDFHGRSSAGGATITNNGILDFLSDSTGGNAIINNNSNVRFFSDSTAGEAFINNSGTIDFFDDSGAGTTTIVNLNNLYFNNASTAGSATVINDATQIFFATSSAGDSRLSNSGALTFAGDSTAARAAIGNFATLRFVDNASGGDATITNHSLLRLEDNATLGNARLITRAGSVTEINPLVAPSATVGSIEGAGQINLGVKNLFVGQSDLSTEFSGIITGAAASDLIKQGAGVLVLSGANLYTGGTHVSGGGLIVNGSIASSAFVNVNDDGTLGGTGTVSATAIHDGGTIAPGNSIGTLNVAGNVTFNPGSFYEAEVNSAGQSDLLNATGTATLNGGTVQVLPFPDFALDTQYTILTAAGGVAGTFDSVDFASNSLFLTPSLAYGANNVFLTTAQTADFDSVALTPNQIAAAGGAQSLGGGSLFNAIAVLGDANDARAAFDAISGEIHASGKTALIEDSRHLREAANSRVRAAFETAGGEGTGVWGHAFGAIGHTASDGNAAALDRSTGGLFAGVDGEAVDNWVFGALAGYSRSGFTATDRASSGTADSFHLGAYGGGEWRNWALRFGGAYSWHNLAVSRTAAFPGFSDNLSSAYSAGTAQLFGELGYKTEVRGTEIEPFANAAWVSHATGGLAEAGGAAALTGTADTVNTAFTTLGLRASRELVTGEGTKFQLTGMAGWRHAFGGGVPTSTLAFAGGSPFTVAGAPTARDALVLEAGIDAMIAPTSTLSLSYSGHIGSGASGHSLKADLGVRF